MSFQEKINDLLKNGYTAATAALGYQLGLFHCFDSTPRTCDDLAARARCKPRYMKEWLSVMVCGGIVESDDGETFYMADENAKIFNTSTQEMTVLNFLPDVYHAFPVIEKCFKEDGPGGTDFTNHERFYEHTPAVQTPLVVIDIANNDPSIRMQLEKTLILIEKGCKCLDIGCGWGTIVCTLAKLYPKSQFYGIDLIPQAIEQANQRCLENNISNAKFVVMDVMKLPVAWTEMFDHVITLHAVHDFAEPDKAAKEIFRVLKPGGFQSLLEFDVHSDMMENRQKEPTMAPILYTVSLFHCMPISLGPKGTGAGLGTLWGKEDAEKLLNSAGFVELKFYAVKNNNFMFHCVSRKPLTVKKKRF